MELRFYNSLSRSQEVFHSLKPNEVGLYTCGPTVYNYAHIGNFRAYVFEDILRRTLIFAGYHVTQVMNLTDVDDKTIRGAKTTGLKLKDYTRPYIDAFFHDLKVLNIQPAEVYPAATDHIPEMKTMITTLFDKGLAYKSEDGSVYFSVAKLPNYGKLAHLDPSQLRSGVRINNDEYDKESFGDFAVWKGWDEQDGDVVWDAPWGKGRPGWHIECSAMSIKYLGESFDMHTGGVDNLFPHHENEIAQAEAVTGKPFVHTWMHCAHLRVNGEKMSKSTGNFFTLRDLIEKGYTGREIRYVLLNGQYRQPLNFTFDSLTAARKSMARIDECIDALAKLAVGQPPNTDLTVAPEMAKVALTHFSNAMADDLNTPEAMAALFMLVKDVNCALIEGLSAPDAVAILATIAQMDTVLGLFGNMHSKDKDEALPETVLVLLEARKQARSDKQWGESDRLRDELAAIGWIVRDSKDGQSVKKA